MTNPQHCTKTYENPYKHPQHCTTTYENQYKNVIENLKTTLGTSKRCQSGPRAPKGAPSSSFMLREICNLLTPYFFQIHMMAARP